MHSRNNWLTRFRILLMFLLCGHMLQGLGCIANAAKWYNPCGTILVCEPLEWEYAVGNLDPYNPNFEECPLSVNPAECLGGAFPWLQGGGGAEPAPL